MAKLKDALENYMVNICAEIKHADSPEVSEKELYAGRKLVEFMAFAGEIDFGEKCAYYARLDSAKNKRISGLGYVRSL